jgi:hypothetical protein
LNGREGTDPLTPIFIDQFPRRLVMGSGYGLLAAFKNALALVEVCGE